MVFTEKSFKRKTYRKFDGRYYQKDVFHRTKEEAERDAKRERAAGHGSRIVKVSDGYQVYTTMYRL